MDEKEDLAAAEAAEETEQEKKKKRDERAEQHEAQRDGADSGFTDVFHYEIPSFPHGSFGAANRFFTVTPFAYSAASA